MKKRIQRLDGRKSELEMELIAVDGQGVLETRGVLDQINNSLSKVVNSNVIEKGKESRAKMAGKMEQLKEKNRNLKETITKGLKQKDNNEQINGSSRKTGCNNRKAFRSQEWGDKEEMRR